MNKETITQEIIIIIIINSTKITTTTPITITNE
jgi:hypothetical protein